MTSYNDETVALCALNKVFGFRPRLGMRLMEEAGSALALFTGEPPGATGHPELIAQLTPALLEWGRKELRNVQDGGFLFLPFTHPAFPAPLLECEDPPIGLYLNASTAPEQIFGTRPVVGIVGTRDISPYGKAWCRKIVTGLARSSHPPAIVSGLAYGADGIAHQAALDCGLPTLGVMATGIEAIYPWRHRQLAMDMVRSPGSALLTDYPMNTSPVAHNFLRRNRIIAGLSQGVIVVESKAKGGSLMTARYACDYSRDVYALPGRADDVRSEGCNALIRNQMAEIITSPEDLAARLGLGAGAGGSGGKEAYRNALEREYGADSEALALAMAVYADRGVTAEELAVRLGWPFPHVLELIGLLEADGYLSTDLLRRCCAVPRR